MSSYFLPLISKIAIPASLKPIPNLLFSQQAGFRRAVADSVCLLKIIQPIQVVDSNPLLFSHFGRLSGSCQIPQVLQPRFSPKTSSQIFLSRGIASFRLAQTSSSAPILARDLNSSIPAGTSTIEVSAGPMSDLEPIDSERTEAPEIVGTSLCKPRRLRLLFRLAANRRRLVRVFPNSPDQVVTSLSTSPSYSSVDSLHHSIQSSANILQGSIPSIELVSTGAFIFSGPALEGESQDSSPDWSEASGIIPKQRLPKSSFGMAASSFSSHKRVQVVSTTVTHSGSQEHVDISPSSTGTRPPWKARVIESQQSRSAIQPSPRSMYPIVAAIVRYADHDTRKTLRLCSRGWDTFITKEAPPKLPTVYHIPQELIQQIYVFLCPSDFNAARHTCHAWMLASLDRVLLQIMLKRGGWYTSSLTKPNVSNITSTIASTLLSTPWFLSRLVARECALQPNWRGNGLRKFPTASLASGTAMTLKYYTDLTDLSSGDSAPGTSYGCGLSFTVSVCGRFILAAEGCVIYIYGLESNRLRPVTSVVCPRRVLATSMDTTANRFSVAALLDSRMGLLCDLESDALQPELPSPRVYSDHSLQTTRYRESTNPSLDINGDASEAAAHNNDHQTSLPSSYEPLPPSDRISSIHIRSPHQTVSLYNASQESERRAINQTWRNNVMPFSQLLPLTGQEFNTAIPVSSTPLSIYHSLCSLDDPPRSVAICPSRRCLAFGCAAGIELHWIDAMSGRNLMKWFPLTAPSDFLYFLPTRRGMDNPNKLRLISSKAGPGQRGALDRYHRRGHNRRRHGLNWSALHFDPGVGSRAADYDHYAAVPISDGSHILFTDPSTGTLCLGSDAPLGGPTRLLRKINFVPPTGVPSSKHEPPKVYAAGSSLNWGVRTVAAYGEHVVLFCVPPDVFADIKKISGTVSAPVHEDGDEYEFGTWSDWWDYGDRTEASALSSAPYVSWTSTELSSPSRRARKWPIPVRGTVIGQVPGLVDLAVQSSAELVIWAFSVDGTASTWQIGGDTTQHPVQRVVERNGAVVDVVDHDGDWIMRDAGSPISPSSGCQSNFPDAFVDGNDVDMVDTALAYEVAYPESEEEWAQAGGSSNWQTHSPANEDARVLGQPYSLDGICEFDIEFGRAAAVPFVVDTAVNKDVVMEDVAPFDVEVLNSALSGDDVEMEDPTGFMDEAAARATLPTPPPSPPMRPAAAPACRRVQNITSKHVYRYRVVKTARSTSHGSMRTWRDEELSGTQKLHWSETIEEEVFVTGSASM